MGDAQAMRLHGRRRATSWRVARSQLASAMGIAVARRAADVTRIHWESCGRGVVGRRRGWATQATGRGLGLRRGCVGGRNAVRGLALRSEAKVLESLVHDIHVQ